MKKLILFLFMICLRTFAQVPATINYQAVARDASGAPVTNTTVNLQFKISTPSAPAFYAETQNAVPVNSLGLLSTKIGINTPLPLTGWQNTPAILNVFIDVNGSGFIALGSQTLSSVPYALYALQSGGSSLPPGTRNGQTLRWDTINNVWQNSGNLTNDNSRVGVGVYPKTIDSKFSVTTTNPLDTAAITAVHYTAQNRTASIRGIALGNTSPTSTNNPYSTAIFGGQHIAYNIGNGFAIGNNGYGSSKGYGVGLAGFGSTQANTGTAVGLYATVDSTSPGNNKYAAIFDKGAVFIGDSLMLNPWKNPGNIGDVLTLTAFNGRVKWKPNGGPWQRSLIGSNFNTHLSNPGDDVSIGLPSGTPAAEKLHVHATSGDAYLQLSTTNTLNSVGLAFGDATTPNKAFFRFDNFSNSLQYFLAGKPVMFIEGASRSTLFGKLPAGVSSQSALNAYDSISITQPRPILRVVNTNTAPGAPTSLFLGHNALNGVNITYRKGPLDLLSFEDINLNQKYHTFSNAGTFFPGSDGATGKAFIQGGATISDDISVNASTNGNIVHAGYTQLGNNGAVYPAIQVLEFTGNMPSSANSNVQFSLAAYIPNSGKIESVQVIVSTPNRTVPQNYTFTAGYECQYEISSSAAPVIFVWTTGNSSQLFGQPVKVVVIVKK